MMGKKTATSLSVYIPVFIRGNREEIEEAIYITAVGTYRGEGDKQAVIL